MTVISLLYIVICIIEQCKPFRIITSEEVKEVRPHIVGCIIKYLDIDSERQFKCFITLQVRFSIFVGLKEFI